MLKHVTHRSTSNLGTGLQRGPSNRRASVPSRPFIRQPSEGPSSTASTPSSCRRSTVHSADTLSSSCVSSPITSHRRVSQSPDIRHPTSERNSPEIARRIESRLALQRRPVHDPPARLGRSMSTPAGCRYPPPGSSPVPGTPPDSPMYNSSKDINYLTNKGINQNHSFTIQEAQQFDSTSVPEAPRSSTLPRRPMSRSCAPTPPLQTALSYSSLPPGGRTSLSARSSSTSSLSDTIVGGPGSGGSKVRM